MFEADGSRSATYNALPEVLDADETLSRIGRSIVLKPLSEVLLRHHLGDDIGIRLLHKHNDIAPDELMLEEDDIDDKNRFCLATMAVPIGELREPVFANSWLLGDDGPIALEYSIDPLVGEASALLGGKQAFLKEFTDTLEAFGATGLLGPCVLDRAFYTSHRPVDDRDHFLIETTDEARRANVVRFGKSAGATPFIETTWQAREFVVPDVTMGCEGSTKKICVPTAVIHCDPQSGGGHSSTTKNGHNEGTETTHLKT